jgi:hypothetical protein
LKSAACADVVKPAAISASVPHPNLLITQLHATAATKPGETPVWLRNSNFSDKIYREF